MSKKFRNIILSASLLASGVIAGSAVGSVGSPAGAVSVRSAQAATFYTISSYRSLDTRVDLGDKMLRAEDRIDNPDQPYALFVQFESGGDGTIQFPNEAIAVSYNVTVTETEGAGFVQVDGFGNATGETSTVNWTGDGQTVANSGVASMTSAFDDCCALGIRIGGAPGARAHVVLDITGYYLPAD